MKKNYIAPNAKTVGLHFSTHLLQDSITGAQGLQHGLNTGGTTTSADSRRNRFWDDEDED